MRRPLAVLFAAALALSAIAPAAADARTEIFTLRSPAFRLAGFQVTFPKVAWRRRTARDTSRAWTGG